MTFQMSDKPRTIKIYNLRADTNEFIGAGDAYIHAFTGLPAHSTNVKPPEVSAGMVAVFDEQKSAWSIVEDHRGKIVYNTENGEGVEVVELGPLPKNTVSVAPDGEFQRWDGEVWIVDEEAKKAALQRDAESQKADLMRMANENILPLQDAVDLEIATDEEVEQLKAWKKFRVMVSRVDTSEPVWPEVPTY
ncbi:tail fiber assembly protein [Trabulsiella odontotermitis]|uniref:tail fiber assembly protein n=1 Tax=Trabulsiella odontotermitis TaxID=379893 RepID=UPI003AD7603A